MRLDKFVAAAFTTAAALWSSPPHADACVKEDEPIDLHGTISREAFPGPPNYQSIERGDAADVVFIITSESPYDICAIDPGTHALRPVGQVRRFQLFRSPDLTLSQLPVVFGRARVRGTITAGLSGPYHTPAAIEVLEFENVGAWAPVASPPPSPGTAYLPVTTTFESAVLSSGWTARIENQSDQTLTVLANLVNPTSGATRSIAITMPPHGATQIGRTQGWAFASGDRILLHNESFADVAIQVP
jgi:hypothetical protein